jgi:APA family basic amino acid/polyamine antiporter
LGYPWVPLIFSLVALLFCISIVWRRPMESLFGLILLALGLPFYLFWQHTSKKTETRAG